MLCQASIFFPALSAQVSYHGVGQLSAFFFMFRLKIELDILVKPSKVIRHGRSNFQNC